MANEYHATGASNGNTVDRRAETVFTKDMTTTTFEVTTECINTRSKSRRVRHHTIAAVSQDDAICEARRRHFEVVGWNSTIDASVKGWARDIRTGHWVEDHGQEGVLR